MNSLVKALFLIFLLPSLVTGAIMVLAYHYPQKTCIGFFLYRGAFDAKICIVSLTPQNIPVFVYVLKELPKDYWKVRTESYRFCYRIGFNGRYFRPGKFIDKMEIIVFASRSKIPDMDGFVDWYTVNGLINFITSNSRAVLKPGSYVEIAPGNNEETYIAYIIYLRKNTTVGEISDSQSFRSLWNTSISELAKKVLPGNSSYIPVLRDIMIRLAVREIDPVIREYYLLTPSHESFTRIAYVLLSLSSVLILPKFVVSFMKKSLWKGVKI